MVEVSGSCDAKPERIIGIERYFASIPTNKWNPYSSTSNLGFYSFTGTLMNHRLFWEWMSASTPKPTTDPNTTGCNTDKSSALKYIDTIMVFMHHVLVSALGLSSCVAKSEQSKDLSDTNVNLVMAPNPASTEINLSVGDDNLLNHSLCMIFPGLCLKCS